MHKRRAGLRRLLKDDESRRVTCTGTEDKKSACDRGVSSVIPPRACAQNEASKDGAVPRCNFLGNRVHVAVPVFWAELQGKML